MKIMTILGTRPEIIRLSRIIEKIDHICEHTVVHTGQNYDPLLTDIFFKELKLRKPDIYLEAKGSFGNQVAQIMQRVEQVLMDRKPDRVLILGDTNSALSALMAKRGRIPVFHMEAGNRCYDDRVPEEVNRRVIDHVSDILLPYTERSRQNLIREGIPGERVYVTGNPINEVIKHFQTSIAQSDVLADLQIVKDRYFLVSLHRSENVDSQTRLRQFMDAFKILHQKYGMPLIVSTHPHTRKKMNEYGIDTDHSGIRFLPPFGFFDFVQLEKNAHCVLSDSGTVQEECTIFEVPTVTLRDVTERPETLECGANMLSGADADSISRSVSTVLGLRSAGKVPPEYLAENVSETVIKILLGYLRP